MRSTSSNSYRRKARICPEILAEVRVGIGDVTVYLTDLSEELKTKLVETIEAKLEIHSGKHPTTLVKGKVSGHAERLSELPYCDLIAIYRRDRTY